MNDVLAVWLSVSFCTSMVSLFGSFEGRSILQSYHIHSRSQMPGSYYCPELFLELLTFKLLLVAVIHRLAAYGFESEAAASA
jgi:hypothetical protein